jgi:hypothetical protein
MRSGSQKLPKHFERDKKSKGFHREPLTAVHINAKNYKSVLSSPHIYSLDVTPS